MYRVELKESIFLHLSSSAYARFLMYRVELKDTKTPLPATALPLFLMYRVELKVLTPPQ